MRTVPHGIDVNQGEAPQARANVAHTSRIRTRSNKISDNAAPLTPQCPDYPTSTLLVALSQGSRQDHRTHVRPLTRITPAT